MGKCRNVTSLCAVTVVFYTDRLPQSSRQPDEVGTPTDSILQAGGGLKCWSLPSSSRPRLCWGQPGWRPWSVRGVAPELLPTPEWRLQGWVGMRLRRRGRDTQQFWWPKEKALGPSHEQGRSAEIPVPPEPGLRGLQGTASP